MFTSTIAVRCEGSRASERLEDGWQDLEGTKETRNVSANPIPKHDIAFLSVGREPPPKVGNQSWPSTGRTRMKPVTKRCQAVLSGSVSKRTSRPSYSVTQLRLPCASSSTR